MASFSLQPGRIKNCSVPLQAEDLLSGGIIHGLQELVYFDENQYIPDKKLFILII
jgi:hypothetical protein